MSSEIMILLGASIFLGYFFESVFGIAGTIIWLSVMSFFVDIKPLIFLGFLTGLSAAFSIFLSGRKDFSFLKWKKMVLFAFPTALLGAFMIDSFSPDILLKVFGVFLVGAGFFSLFPRLFHLNIWGERFFLLLGGWIQGLFGTGGPLVVVAMKRNFLHKSEMRATLAAFFLFFQALRGGQYYVQGSFDFFLLLPFWWIPPLIFIAVFLGLRVHISISEEIFQKGVSLLIIFSGIFFLLF